MPSCSWQPWMLCRRWAGSHDHLHCSRTSSTLQWLSLSSEIKEGKDDMNNEFLYVFFRRIKSISPFIYSSNYPSIHTYTVYLSLCFSICLSTCIYLSVYMYLPIYLSFLLSVYPSIHVSISSIYLHVSTCIYPSIYLAS